MKSEDIFRELNEIDVDMILDAAPGEQKVIPLFQRPTVRRLAALAVSLLLMIGALSIVGFDNVSAAMRELFSFIPGVGIEPAGSVIYTYEPITGSVSGGGHQAQIFRATYSGGTLSVTVSIEGCAIYPEEFRFYHNGAEIDLHGNDDLYYSLAVSQDSSMIDFAIPMEPPTREDRFEVEIDGLEGRLAFGLRPCETFEELQEIGPTVTLNGISITATAHRTGNELVVWCYETRDETAVEDQLFGFGIPGNGSNVVMKYVETQSGRLQNSASGFVLRNRSIYQLADTDTTATLHIPYLSMYREEHGKTKISLPNSYGLFDSDIEIKTSLGKIEIVTLERKPLEDNPQEDCIRIEFDYANTDQQKRMYAFSYEIDGHLCDYTIFDPEAGEARYLVLTVSKDTKKLDFVIKGVEYYLMGEYVIELDIQK